MGGAVPPLPNVLFALRRIRGIRAGRLHLPRYPTRAMERLILGRFSITLR